MISKLFTLFNLPFSYLRLALQSLSDHVIISTDIYYEACVEMPEVVADYRFLHAPSLLGACCMPYAQHFDQT